MHHVREIDGLRGIAASGIVLFHMFPTYTFWMWSFVDLFFVLSGYLVTGILLQERAANTLSLKNFWMRRILRIWPVYFVTLLGVMILLGIQQGGLASWQGAGAHFRLSAVFLQFTPYYLLGNGDPWQPFDFIPGFFHSWSLAIEEQYYLLWPLLLSLLLRFGGAAWALFACVSLFVFSAFARSFLDWTPILLFSRADGLALGALMAILIYQKKFSADMSIMRGLFAVCFVVGTLTALPYLLMGYTQGAGAEDFFNRPLIVTSFALIYFGMLGLVLGTEKTVWTGLLAHPWLVYLGSISYAMYMFHFPVLKYIEPRISEIMGSQRAGLTALLTIGLLLLSCHLSKHWLEKPVLALKKRFY